MKSVRIIGDCHQNEKFYLNLIKDCEYSLQIGDMGFSYKWLEKAGLDPNKHKFVGGNHDNYDEYYDSPHALGDYGTIPLIPNSFFVRGGFSIDVKYRTPGLDWWNKEEMSWDELEKAYEEYCRIKPEYMFSHECPLSLVSKITDGRVTISFGFPAVLETRTNLTLERMFKFHSPKFWIYGHFHRDFDEVINGTRFMCLTADGRPDTKQTYFDLEV
jgi:predicted phosphodiesterase